MDADVKLRAAHAGQNLLDNLNGGRSSATEAEPVPAQCTGLDIPRRLQGRRLPPRDPEILRFAYHGSGIIPSQWTAAPPGPVELRLEVTDDCGKLAPWFDDGWWVEAIRLCEDRPVAVHVAPSPEALLHPAVLHALETLRRVVSHWRLTGHAFCGDVVSEREIAALAASAYHEVRIIDRPRPASIPVNHVVYALPFEELVRRFREQEKRLGRTGPLLIRVPDGAGHGVRA